MQPFSKYQINYYILAFNEEELVQKSKVRFKVKFATEHVMTMVLNLFNHYYIINLYIIIWFPECYI